MAGSDPHPRFLESWLLLGLIAATSPERRRRIEQHYGSLDAAAGAGPAAWLRDGLLRRRRGKSTLGAASGQETPEVLVHLQDTGGWVARQLEEARRRGARFLRWGSEGYPPMLGVAPDPPPVIYVRGNLASFDSPAVAVVGARRASRYGMDVARRLGRQLADAGLVVVSGGARGIDSGAHWGALEAGGSTISVMGCGLDEVYPPENAALFRRIAERGALVSEFPFGITPRPQHFPVRNRVIAGLTLGVIVVEGKEGSGSLITAARALEANREVMAVPGPVTSELSDGPNRLIAEGARLVRTAADVVEALPSWAGVAPPEPGGAETSGGGPGLGAELKTVLELLDLHEGRPVDELAKILGIGSGEVLGRLTALELEGWIEQLPGGRYARRK